MGPLNNEEVVNPKTKNIRLYVKRVFISDDFDGELVSTTVLKLLSWICLVYLKFMSLFLLHYIVIMNHLRRKKVYFLLWCVTSSPYVSYLCFSFFFALYFTNCSQLPGKEELGALKSTINVLLIFLFCSFHVT